ncbi:Ig-like domain-containing protein [Planomonospora sp. ID91781]|uniref:Ig-like domain-containing protein n=1 Tax=Planomonospora sp. ID91781 TaxID=2738135 RepID=UPI0018C35E53|nr:Ig-like domain-containing protein [Planomonospora sp. ID91781]MBG0823390.1 Ig-like domain-containing protein [Planomonospora sp. ID91781]
MLTLPLSLMSAPAIAQVSTPSPAPTSTSTPPGAASDPTLKSAWEKATKSGKPVEVPSRSTETMKVWADPDGKNLRAELHTRPVQLKNPASGAWEPIDTRIVTRDSKLQATRVKTPLTFGGRGTKHLVSAAGEDGKSGLGVTRALPEPKVSGNAITYPDAIAPGVDLVVLAQADGFVSQVVFRRKPTGPVTVRLPLTLPKDTTFGTTPQGLPQLKDADGKPKAAPIVLTAMDAKVEASPEEGKTSPVEARVETSGTKPELVFSPDEKFLADPAVTYPVTIAAASEWFGGGVPTDAWVSKNNPSANNAAAGWLRVGTTQTSADIARVYLKFDTEAPELEGATVIDADLYVWNYKSGGPNGQLCGEIGSGIAAALVTSPWTLDGSSTSLSWNRQPSNNGVAGGSGNKYGYSIDASGTWCAKEEALVHRVSGMARAWIEQGVPNYGVMLRAVTESPALNWRQYYASEHGGQPYPGYRHPPTLMVEYTPAEEFEIAYERDGLPNDDLPTYEEVLANQIPLSDFPPSYRVRTLDEVAALAEATTQTFETDQDDLPTAIVPPDNSEPDANPPKTVATAPVKDAQNVSVLSRVMAFLDEPVTGAQVTVRDASGQIIPGVTTANSQGDILTFSPAQQLPAASTFTAEASGGKDAAGNTMAAHSWSFSTDRTPPTVTSTSPAKDAADVELDSTIKVTFSEKMSDVQLTLKDGAGAAVEGTGVLDGTGKAWTFTPAQRLKWNATYAAELAAKDASGNAMEPHKWSFATVTDHEAPTITKTVPAKDAVDVKVTETVKATFSEPVSDVKMTVADAASTTVAGSLTVADDGKGVTFTPAAPLAVMTSYTVTVTEAKDPAGNVMIPHSWVFTTRPPDVVPPTVSSTVPASDATGVLPTDVIKVIFSEAVTDTQITVTDAVGAQAAGTLSVDSATAVSWRPTGSLAGETRYTVTVSGAKDEAGNTMAAAHSWSFTSGSLPPPPDAPTISSEYVTPTNDTGAVTSLTPTFRAYVTDPEGRSSLLSVEVEHDPAAAGQGTGLIWSGTGTTSVPSGNYTGVTMPSGKLTDGWKIRWRARAVTTSGMAGAWTDWNNETVSLNKPSASDAYVTPTNDTGAVTSLTPTFRAYVTDPEGRSSLLSVEVEHDPAAAGQGTGLIWSGTGTTSVPSGNYTGVTMPSGKLTDGWKIRWRARAVTTSGMAGAWTDWNNETVSLNKPSASDAYVTPTNDTGAVTSLTPTFRAYVTDPEGRSSLLSVEVEHDPAAAGQGTGLIWSGTGTTSVPSGNYTGVTMPSGKLTDGWKIRWRARAVTTSGMAGAWTDWNNETVSLNKPSASDAYVTPTNDTGAVTSLTPTFRAYVTDPEGRSSLLSVEVEHDPAAAGQGTGLIWSGTGTTSVPSGNYTGVTMPSGKLTDGWKIRWRARAVTTSGMAGAWTDWNNETVSLNKPLSGTTNSRMATSVQTNQAAAAGHGKGWPWVTRPDKRITFSDCWSSKMANSKRTYPLGWVRDSYNWCAVRTVGKTRVRKLKDPCGCKHTITGKIEFLFSVAGHTFTGDTKIDDEGNLNAFAEKAYDSSNKLIDSRTTQVWARVDKIKVTGTSGPLLWPETSRLDVDMGFYGTGCRQTQGGSARGTLAHWRANPQVYFEYFSDKNASSGPHKLATCDLNPMIVAGNGPSPYVLSKMANMTVRCDTSETLTLSYGGCVFADHVPTFKAKPVWGHDSNGNPIPNYSAMLIQTALDDPNATYPKAPNGASKVIPGSRDKGPLHRSSNAKRNGKNRSQSLKFCAQLANEPDYPWDKAPDEDCDEYPFAATHEGSAGPQADSINYNVAVNLIPRSPNRSVGSLMNWFCHHYRVLGSHPDTGADTKHAFGKFYVTVTNR